MTAKTTRKKTTKKAEAKTTKLSALDAAAKVLGQTRKPMNAKELIEAMKAKRLWTSPAGATPHATLYAAMLREINVKGSESRFVRSGKGQFELNGKPARKAKAKKPAVADAR